MSHDQRVEEFASDTDSSVRIVRNACGEPEYEGYRTYVTDNGEVVHYKWTPPSKAVLRAWLLGASLAFIGFALAGFDESRRVQKFEASAIEADGLVQDRYWGWGRDSPEYLDVFFTDKDGVSHSFARRLDNYAWKLDEKVIRQLTTGSHVPVWYVPEQPGNSELFQRKTTSYAGSYELGAFLCLLAAFWCTVELMPVRGRRTTSANLALTGKGKDRTKGTPATGRSSPRGFGVRRPRGAR